MDMRELEGVCRHILGNTQEEFTIRQLLLLILVDRHPGSSLVDIEHYSGLPKKAVAKNARLLGTFLDGRQTAEQQRKGIEPMLQERGHDLVISRINPLDNRRRSISLTKKGVEFMSKLRGN